MELDRLEAFRLALRDIVDIGLVVVEERRRRIGEDLVPRAAQHLIERQFGVARRHVPQRDVDERLRLRHLRGAEIAIAMPQHFALGGRLADHVGQEIAQCFADRPVEAVGVDHRRAGNALKPALGGEP